MDVDKDNPIQIVQTVAFSSSKSQLRLTDLEKLEVEQIQASPRKASQTNYDGIQYPRELILRLIHWFKDS